MPIELWDELHAERWLWVDRAVTQFVEGIDPTLQSHFERRDAEYNAVMFGPTQSGKTTLILRLLGVAEPRLAEVSEVLRAGREQGESSTTTPTRYQWSTEGESWQYRKLVTGSTYRASAEDISESDLKKKLIADRRAIGCADVEAGVVEIGIPRRFRSPGHGGAVPRILDLPGAQAKDADEERFAAGLIRRHLPTAHVIVLVTRAPQISTSLFAGLAAELPELAMWTDAPERFRIVVTHAVSQASVSSMFRANMDDANIESLKRHMVEQMFTKLATSEFGNRDGIVGPDQHERISRAIFPVEYGLSWSDFKQDNPLLHSVAEPVVERMLAELSASLGDQASEDASRIGILKAASTIHSATDRHLRNLIRDKEVAKEAVAKLSAARGRSIGELKHVSRCLARAKRHRKLLRKASKAPRLFPMPQHHPTGTTRDQVTDAGALFARTLQAQWRGEWSQWLSSSAVVELITATKKIPPVPVNASLIFTEHWHCCERCYVWRFWHPPNHCNWRQTAAAEMATKEVNNAAARAVSDWIAEAKPVVEQQVTYWQRRCVSAERALRIADQRHQEAEMEYQDAKRSVESYKGVAEDARLKAMQLEESLGRSLEERLREYGHRMMQEPDTDRRHCLGLAVGLTLLTKERIELERTSVRRQAR